MQDSHTPAAAEEAAALDRLRLVPTATLGCPKGLLAAWTGTWPGSPSTCARAAGRLVAVGLEVMAELMEAEVTALAGPKGKHNPARAAKRHGGQDGTVTLGAGGSRSVAHGFAPSATTSASWPWRRMPRSCRPTCSPTA